MHPLLARLPLLALLRREFAGYSPVAFQRNLLAGLTVGAVGLPLALAFGVASGADAPAGLVTAILAGLIIGGLGGAAYQISGPTGAMSAVLIVIAGRYGLEGVWVATLLAGVMALQLAVLEMFQRTGLFTLVGAKRIYWSAASAIAELHEQRGVAGCPRCHAQGESCAVLRMAQERLAREAAGEAQPA